MLSHRTSLLGEHRFIAHVLAARPHVSCVPHDEAHTIYLPLPQKPRPLEGVALLLQVLAEQHPDDTSMDWMDRGSSRAEPYKKVHTALKTLAPQQWRDKGLLDLDPLDHEDLAAVAMTKPGLLNWPITSDLQLLKQLASRSPNVGGLGDLVAAFRELQPLMLDLWRNTAKKSDRSKHLEVALELAPTNAPLNEQDLVRLREKLVDVMTTLCGLLTNIATAEGDDDVDRSTSHHDAGILVDILSKVEEITGMSVPDLPRLRSRLSSGPLQSGQQPRVLGLLDRGNLVTLRFDHGVPASDSVKVAIKTRPAEDHRAAYFEMFQTAMQQVNGLFGARFSVLVFGSSEYFNLGIGSENLFQEPAQALRSSIKRQGVKVGTMVIANDADLLTMAPPLLGHGIAVVAGAGSTVVARRRNDDGTVWFHRWGGIDSPFSDHGAAASIVEAMARHAVDRHQCGAATDATRKVLVDLANHWELRERSLDLDELGTPRADYAISALVARRFSTVGGAQPRKFVVSDALSVLIPHERAVPHGFEEIVAANIAGLAEHFVSAVSSFHGEPPPVIVAGPLLNRAWWRTIFEQQIRAAAGQRERRVRDMVDAVMAGSLLNALPRSVSSSYISIGRLLSASPSSLSDDDSRVASELTRKLEGDFHSLCFSVGG
jgi:hypothetical protein